MCEYISATMIISFISLALTNLVTIWKVFRNGKKTDQMLKAANEERKNQNKYSDAKENLPVLLSILEDLNILNQAYVFCGKFCPQIEHRMPTLSNKDGDGPNMSYAQRAHQFRMFGYRIIRNCKTMIFLTPPSHLPQVIAVCKEIVKSLEHRKNRLTKIRLDYISNVMLSCLSKKESANDEMMRLAQQFQKWHDDLNQAIEKELSSLWS